MNNLAACERLWPSSAGEGSHWCQWCSHASCLRPCSPGLEAWDSEEVELLRREALLACFDTMKDSCYANQWARTSTDIALLVSSSACKPHVASLPSCLSQPVPLSPPPAPPTSDQMVVENGSRFCKSQRAKLVEYKTFVNEQRAKRKQVGHRATALWGAL